MLGLSILGDLFGIEYETHKRHSLWSLKHRRKSTGPILEGLGFPSSLSSLTKEAIVMPAFRTEVSCVSAVARCGGQVCCPVQDIFLGSLRRVSRSCPGTPGTFRHCRAWEPEQQCMARLWGPHHIATLYYGAIFLVQLQYHIPQTYKMILGVI